MTAAAFDAPVPCEPDWTEPARRGRDTALPGWLHGREAADTARFDSAVVRGNGVSALTCAARLARSDAFRGRVVVASERPTEMPKLINGCTLRARSLDYFSAAFGVSPDAVLQEVFGGRAADAASHTQRFGLFRPTKSGRFETIRQADFMPRTKGRRVWAYGVRNSRLAGALATLLDGCGVTWSSTPTDSLDACRRAAPGERPIVIGGSHAPLEGAPKTAGPSCFVAAWQCTMRRRKDAPLPAHTSLVAAVRAGGGTDIGVFYPFLDPLTPDADMYGLFYRIVSPGEGFSKEKAIEDMRRTALGVGEQVGLEAVAEEATGAGALVPGFAWSDVPSELGDYFDLHRTFGAGIPIITGCGMTRAGLAGWVAAEALLRGEDPAAAVNGSLAGWRRINRIFSWGMTGPASGPMTALLGLAPGPVMRMTADRPDVWARVGSAGSEEAR